MSMSGRHSRVKRLLVAGLSLLALSACEVASTGGAPPSGPSQPSGRTVAQYFSPPQAYPGPVWTKDGRPVDGRELNSIAGPDHCGWQSAVMMHLGWPLGTVSQTSDEIRQFIRDPDRVIAYGVGGELSMQVALPADARATGYRMGEVELWLAASEPQAAFVRVGDDVERWPRADPVVACD